MTLVYIPWPKQIARNNLNISISGKNLPLITDYGTPAPEEFRMNLMFNLYITKEEDSLQHYKVCQPRSEEIQVSVGTVYSYFCECGDNCFSIIIKSLKHTRWGWDMWSVVSFITTCICNGVIIRIVIIIYQLTY